MSDFLHELMNGYQYFDKIKGPDAMDMCSDGTDACLKNDIGGLIAYVKLLTEGGGEASDPELPLGTKFFMSTSSKCKDTDGNMQDRYIYFNTIPTGNIELMPGASLDMNSFKGLVPGILEDIGKINPFNMLAAFMENQEARCIQVKLPVGDAGSLGTGNQTSCGYEDSQCKEEYMIFPDIELIPTDLFNSKYPKSHYKNIINDYKNKKLIGEESFQQRTDDLSISYNPILSSTLPNTPFNSKKLHRKPNQKTQEKKLQNKIPSSKMPDDILIKIYFSALGLFGLYILMKLLHKNR